jgi:hypothetical protein
MSPTAKPKGKCTFCGREMTRGGMARHLPACPERKAAIAAADQAKGQSQQLWHLQVQDAGWGGYWLHLEMNGGETLDVLDSYLRAIWLECCGHLSKFTIGGWVGEDIGMRRKVQNVLKPGVELTHLYDFGTTSYTLIRGVAVRTGKPLTKRPILLMARNNPLEFACQECGQPATRLCMECIYGYDKDGTLCDEHAEDHPHEDYGGLMPIVNSPRMGMCGYTGPAEPPY